MRQPQRRSVEPDPLAMLEEMTAIPTISIEISQTHATHTEPSVWLVTRYPPMLEATAPTLPEAITRAYRVWKEGQ